ncbi:MAG: transposase [Candidatus Chisholmbacteria bacterium]|nr:transposase [Candidatus Chisholmbacteria bacterium]
MKIWDGCGRVGSYVVMGLNLRSILAIGLPSTMTTSAVKGLLPYLEGVATLHTLQGVTFKGMARQPKNYHEKIKLLAYCLMPNHFHLLIQQTDSEVIAEFMQSLTTRYTMYFNKRHKRVGALFQGAYRAVLIQEDAYLLHLSRYIHRNPSEYVDDISKGYSSYADYLGLRQTSWIEKRTILAFFKEGTLTSLRHINSYQSFVEQTEIPSEEFLGELVIEEVG